MPHRSPTAADIGKQVEVGIQNDWFDAELVSFTVYEGYTEYEFRWAPDDTDTDTTFECRVPYSCPDPIAELSMAADLLVELGAPEAARVLMREVERLSTTQDDSERYGGFVIAQLPVDSVKTRHDGWFYVHDAESDYLRKDGRFHGTCGDEGFYETREEARQAIDEYNALTPNPEPQP